MRIGIGKRRAINAAHRDELLAKRRAWREAKRLAVPDKAGFRLALPLSDLAEFAHLIGSVPEPRPDGLRAPGP